MIFLLFLFEKKKNLFLGQISGERVLSIRNYNKLVRRAYKKESGRKIEFKKKIKIKIILYIVQKGHQQIYIESQINYDFSRTNEKNDVIMLKI